MVSQALNGPTVTTSPHAQSHGRAEVDIENGNLHQPVGTACRLRLSLFL
jgi:hypothetical protein